MKMILRKQENTGDDTGCYDHCQSEHKEHDSFDD